MKVFVYGTLKRGYGNNRLLERAVFMTEAMTVDKFDMINSGFPVLVPSEHGLPVKGEVYDIGTDQVILDALDRLEGEGVMYDRRNIRVSWPDDEQATVGVYIGNPKYWGRKIGGTNPLTDQSYVRDGYLEWSR